MMGAIKIMIVVAVILAILLGAAFALIRAIPFESRKLYEQGYILTCKNRPAICFENYMEATAYRERAMKRGVHYRLYMLTNGRIKILL